MCYYTFRSAIIRNGMATMNVCSAKANCAVNKIRIILEVFVPAP